MEQAPVQGSHLVSINISSYLYDQFAVVKSAGNEIRSDQSSHSGEQLPSKTIFYFLIQVYWTVQAIWHLPTTNLAMEIPRGSSREEIKARKQIISDFYASWNAEHPDKRVWNKSLGAYIYVKFQSINETKGQASISYESTIAVFKLTEILENAIVAKRKPAKNNDKNQRPYDQMVFLYYKGIRLLVGHQKSKDEYVQYCITTKK